MIATKDVRARLGVSRWQIHQYRKAGLFAYDPISVSYGGLGGERVYPEEALVGLEILEGLRKRGFGLKATKILYLTLMVGEGTRDYISFDAKARIVIAPEKLGEAKQIIEGIVKSYDLGYEQPPSGDRPAGRG